MDLEAFLAMKGPLFDVRSPEEYKKGHIPGALSLPLFTDVERSIVGTLYKQTSPESAYLKGLDLVGPKLSLFAQKALEYRKEPIRIYCWRGGSRSQSMAWLFKLMGCKVETLDRGYKAFRRGVSQLETLLHHYQFVILGGWTGSGKSAFLREQKSLPFIDLEELASHRGSALGEIFGVAQPSQEHFENLLYSAIKVIPKGSKILIEDESRLLGKVMIPTPLFQRMITSPLLFLDTPREERLTHLVEAYSITPEVITKIQKRLGGAQTRVVQDLLERGEKREAASLLIDYYDKTYAHALQKRGRLTEAFPTKEKLHQKLTWLFENFSFFGDR